MADSVLKIEELALQIAALDQQQPHPVTGFGLDVRGAEPARPHDMSYAERIGRVGLVALRRHRGADMTGFQTDDRNTALLQPRMQPRRQRASLVPDAPELRAIGCKRGRDRLGIGWHGRLHHHLSSLVDHANRGLVDRHIQSCKAIHLRSPARPCCPLL